MFRKDGALGTLKAREKRRNSKRVRRTLRWERDSEASEGTERGVKPAEMGCQQTALGG